MTLEDCCGGDDDDDDDDVTQPNNPPQTSLTQGRYPAAKPARKSRLVDLLVGVHHDAEYLVLPDCFCVVGEQLPVDHQLAVCLLQTGVDVVGKMLVSFGVGQAHVILFLLLIQLLKTDQHSLNNCKFAKVIMIIIIIIIIIIMMMMMILFQ